MKWKIEKIKEKIEYQKLSFQTSATFEIYGISYVSHIYYERYEGGYYYTFSVDKMMSYKGYRICVMEKVVKERFYNSPQFLLFFETIKFAKNFSDSEVERG